MSAADFSGAENAPDPELADKASEVVMHARRIRTWQESRKPKQSDEMLVRQFPGLGSSKTYKLLREGETSGLNVDNHLPKYRSVWAQIEDMAKADGAEELYEDLTPALECAAAVAGVMLEAGKQRLVLIEGPTGSGKTTALSLVAKKYPGQAVFCEASEGWASTNYALGEIARTVCGRLADELPSSSGGRLNLILAALRQSRRVLIIDEGHHMTAQVLNVLKTIINQTTAVIVVAAIDSLWRKLSARSWEEARQLVHNRMFARIRLEKPSAADAEIFLERRLGSERLTNGWKAAAARLAHDSQHLGHFAFFRKIVSAVREGAGEITGGELITAAANLKTQLGTR